MQEAELELEVEEEEEIPATDEHVQQLVEATGRPSDECLAALLQHRGCMEEAAAQLLDGGELGEPSADGDAAEAEADGATGSSDAGIPAAAESEGVEDPMSQVLALEGSDKLPPPDAFRLAEVTGRPLAHCIAAFHAHGGRLDDAAVYLLSEAAITDAATGSASQPSSASRQEGLGDGEDAEPPPAKRRRRMLGEDDVEDDSIPDPAGI